MADVELVEVPLPPKSPVVQRIVARKLPRCGEPHPRTPKYTCMRSPEHGGRHQLWRWEYADGEWNVTLENFPHDE